MPNFPTRIHTVLSRDYTDGRGVLTRIGTKERRLIEQTTIVGAFYGVDINTLRSIRSGVGKSSSDDGVLCIAAYRISHCRYYKKTWSSNAQYELASFPQASQESRHAK